MGSSEQAQTLKTTLEKISWKTVHSILMRYRWAGNLTAIFYCLLASFLLSVILLLAFLVSHLNQPTESFYSREGEGKGAGEAGPTALGREGIQRMDGEGPQPLNCVSTRSVTEDAQMSQAQQGGWKAYFCRDIKPYFNKKNLLLTIRIRIMSLETREAYPDQLY